MLVGLKSLAIGGGDITDDIAAAFGTRRVEAERIKCFYGSAMTSPARQSRHDRAGPDRAAARRASRRRASPAPSSSRVIRQRLEGLMAQIEEALKTMGFGGAIGRQVVLTGGGAELKGIADYAQGVLGRTVRIGRPQHAGPAGGA